MAAVRDQVLAAGRERRVQIEPGHAAATSPSPGFAPNSSSEISTVGPVVLLGQPPGDDADHARVPAAPGEHQCRQLVRIARLLGQLIARPDKRSAPASAAAR